MFPNGWPGKGLFVLRVAGGVPVVWDAFQRIFEVPQRESLLLLAFAAVAGLFLLAGLLTPFAGICISIAELCLIIGSTDHVRGCLVQLAIGASAAMLGPGAWSLDAQF